MESDSLLITRQDLQSLRPTATLDKDRIEPYIRGAQTFDLRPFLGDAFYFDLQKKFDKSDDAMYNAYQDLLNGKDYNDTNSSPIHFDGIKSMLGYYTFARFLPENPLHITRFGVVTKTADQSAPATGNDIKTVVNILKGNAVTLQYRVEQFLDANKTVYTLWKKSAQTTTRRSGFRIYKL